WRPRVRGRSKVRFAKLRGAADVPWASTEVDRRAPRRWHRQFQRKSSIVSILFGPRFHGKPQLRGELDADTRYAVASHVFNPHEADIRLDGVAGLGDSVKALNDHRCESIGHLAGLNWET